MRLVLKRLFKSVIGYGAVQWAGPFLSFIFTPIITRVVNPGDYGVADFVLTIATFVGTLALFALPQALTAHFNDQPTGDWQRRLIGSALVTTSVLALIIGAIILVLAPQLADYAFGNQQYVHLFQLTGASVLFGVGGSVLTNGAQAALRVRWGMLFSIVTVVLTVVGNVVFIVVLRLGPTGMILAPITTGICVWITALVTMRRQIGRPSAAILRLLLTSGAILFPTMISAWALQVVDRFFLVQYVTIESLGYYAIANKIASLLGVLMAPIYAAWTPLALSIQREPDAQQRYATVARYLIGVVLLGALALGLFSTEILLIFTRAPYLPASPYVGFLAYIHVFSGFSMVLYTSALAGKQLKAISLSTLIGAVTNIVLNFALIPPYGVWGATIATAIGYGVPTVCLYGLLRKRYPVPYPVKRLLAALALEGGLLIIGLALPPLPFVGRVALKLAIFALLPIGYIILGIITPFEVRNGWLAVRSTWRRFRTT